MTPDLDEGGEAPCFAHLFEDEDEKNATPDRVITVTVSPGDDDAE